MKMYLMKAAEKFRIPLKSMRDHAWLRPIRELHRRFCFETRMRDLGCDRLEPSAPITRFRKRSNHQEPKHILICGWYGTETLGDKAILGGIVNSLRDALGDFSLYVASLEPYVTRLTVRQMPELKGTIVYAVEEAIRRVKEMDLVLFGGGPLMAIDSIIPDAAWDRWDPDITTDPLSSCSSLLHSGSIVMKCLWNMQLLWESTLTMTW